MEGISYEACVKCIACQKCQKCICLKGSTLDSEVEEISISFSRALTKEIKLREVGLKKSFF